MDNERVLIATDRQTLFEVMNEVMNQRSEPKNLPEFEKDRLSKKQAAKLAGISIPTLDKRVKEKKFKQYSLGVHKYFLRSEIIEALRNNS